MANLSVLEKTKPASLRHHFAARKIESLTKLSIQFVDGVKPMWEDPANTNGGRWVIRVQKGYANKLWEDLLLATIGDQFEPANEVNGIIVSVKQQGDQIAIWNRNSNDPAVVE